MHILHELSRIWIVLFFVKCGPISTGRSPHAGVLAGGLARRFHCRSLDRIKDPVIFIIHGGLRDGIAIDELVSRWPEL